MAKHNGNVPIFAKVALLGSVTGAGLQQKGYSMQAMFRFLEYGIYVDAGTGNGYKRGYGGNLEILDKAYRYDHKMGKQRKRRSWFSRSWAISTRVIGEEWQKSVGDEYVGLFDNLEE